MWNEVNFIELANLLSLGENEVPDIRLEYTWTVDEKEVSQFNEGVLKYGKESLREWGGGAKGLIQIFQIIPSPNKKAFIYSSLEY